MITATPSANLIDKSLSIFPDIQSSFFIFIPLGLLIYFFKISTTYNKDNDTYHTSILDLLERHVFTKVVVPLYSSISDNLFDDAYNHVQSMTTRDKKNFLISYDERKKELLKQRDFSLLEDSDLFIDAIEEIIRSKKNQMVFHKLVNQMKHVLTIAVIINLLFLFSGISILVSNFVFQNKTITAFSVGAWCVFGAIALIVAIKYWVNCMTIDNLKHVNE